uniref:Inter-alpha-trypsin inhibitor heavy chain 3 n=1 Tax=Oreochromis niloticus TaxID=8128 RepID=A0A669CMP1_ORENI
MLIHYTWHVIVDLIQIKKSDLWRETHFYLLTFPSVSLSQVEVYSVTVDCTVTSCFAHTVMTSKAFNKASSSQEILFEVELPKTAFITNFSMEIEGQVYVGEVKEKEKAKKQYEKAVSSGQTAGLVKASGRKMEKFSVSVNIAAESNVTFVLTYEELLQRKLGRYELLTRVKPKTLVQDFQIVTNIYEPQGISYVDAHATFLSNELLPLVEKTVTDRKAHISFSPTMEQQRKCPGCDGTLIDGDFIVSYDVKREKNLGDIQIVNGYFVHFFAPELPKLPKNVVFVIDTSTSMSGRKIVQTREAMLAILQQVHEDDHFAIVRFDSVIETWKDSLTKATKENIIEAMDYIRRIDSRGWTNINDAVLKAVNMLVKDRQMERLPERSADMIILLTDGMPSVGERDIGKIQENVRTAIGGNMSLYCLGFGNDVDYSFLDVMSRQNKGLARRIFEASDAVVQLQGFYDEVASPLLLEVDMHYPDNAVDSLTISHFSQFFNGTEIVVAGHLMDNDLDNFLVEVVGRGLEEDFRVQGQVSAADWDVFYPDEEYIFGDFTERLWAYLTIQQLLDKSGTPDEKASTTAKALDMSLQYSFVTPLTSMVVTKPETEDSPSSTLIADKLTEGTWRKQSLKMQNTGLAFLKETKTILNDESEGCVCVYVWLCVCVWLCMCGNALHCSQIMNICLFFLTEQEWQDEEMGKLYVFYDKSQKRFMGQSQFVVFVLIWILFSLFKDYGYILEQSYPRSRSINFSKYIIYSSYRVIYTQFLSSRWLFIDLLRCFSIFIIYFVFLQIANGFTHILCGL